MDEPPACTLQDDGRALQSWAFQDHFAIDHEKHVLWAVASLEQAGSFGERRFLAGRKQTLWQQFVKLLDGVCTHG